MSEWKIDFHCNWQHFGCFLINVQLLSHILDLVVFACTLSQVALVGILCVVVAILEHAACYGLEGVGMFLPIATMVLILIDDETLLNSR